MSLTHPSGILGPTSQKPSQTKAQPKEWLEGISHMTNGQNPLVGSVLGQKCPLLCLPDCHVLLSEDVEF